LIYLSKYIGGYREYNLNWKGGKVLNKGYYYIHKPEHPFATKLGYIAEHRLIWEISINACLLPWSEVHHKNGNTTDNRIENLEAMTKSSHVALHNTLDKTIDMNYRICLLCLINGFDVKDKTRHYWYKVKEGFICRKCYYHIKWFSKKL